MHHLRSLEQSGILSAVMDGRHKWWFAGPTADSSLLILRNRTTKNLLDFIRQHPGASQSDAARQLGLTPQAVPRHVKRLQVAGLLRTEKTGRIVRLFWKGS
jgi:predicted transcriptional regulator